MKLKPRKGSVPFLVVPALICPECGSTMYTEVIDSIRLRIRGSHCRYKDSNGNLTDGCSRSDNEIIRPLAQFTVWI